MVRTMTTGRQQHPFRVHRDAHLAQPGFIGVGQAYVQRQGGGEAVLGVVVPDDVGKDGDQ